MCIRDRNMADDDYSTKTIRDVYNILNAMFKYAVHNRILTFNPCAGVEVPKTKKMCIRDRYWGSGQNGTD